MHSQTQKIIYHYTSETHLKEILLSRELKVSDSERKNKILPPALWLSLNPEWENTATKLIAVNGHARRMTKTEQYEKFGLIRFSIPFDKDSLCSWGKYKYKSNTPSEVYYALERSGIADGAKPIEWFASFKNIPLSKCLSCEKWSGAEWEKLTDLKNPV